MQMVWVASSPPRSEAAPLKLDIECDPDHARLRRTDLARAAAFTLGPAAAAA